jgi:hypothetical protein
MVPLAWSVCSLVAVLCVVILCLLDSENFPFFLLVASCSSIWTKLGVVGLNENLNLKNLKSNC